ncbi:MAG: thymidylate synthase [Gammaproteobacteria bacterium]|nr:thymidylate synthase [Gammaproteobacteria bacterium]
MKHPEQQYLDLLKQIMDEGSDRMDRTGVGTRAIFGAQMRFDLAKGFPALTTKRVFWKTAFKEILWMLSGDTNIKPLIEQNVHIWTDWPLKSYNDQTGENLSMEAFEAKILADDDFAKQWGELGPVYGKQWRKWATADGKEIDQVSEVIQQLKENPTSRRIIFEGWNVGELEQMALPPCHKTYQFFVDEKQNKLSGMLYQRSVDAFLGLGFNIANMALIIHLLAKMTGYKVGDLVWVGADTHLYSNHFEQVKEQLTRTPRDLPTLNIKADHASLFDYKIDDFELESYDPHPAIKAPVAV